MVNERVRRYVSSQRNRVTGWFSRIDAEIFAALMLDQAQRGVTGDLLEIGVYQGESFIVLNLCLGVHETSIAVDIFRGWESGTDNMSDESDLAAFERNLGLYGTPKRSRLIRRLSSDVTPSEIKSGAGLRFIHIDGAIGSTTS
jgi:hypothetical protein